MTEQTDNKILEFMLLDSKRRRKNYPEDYSEKEKETLELNQQRRLLKEFGEI